MSKSRQQQKKQPINLRTCLWYGLLCSLILACGGTTDKQAGEQQKPDVDTLIQMPTHPLTSIQTFQNDDGRWGYDIFLGKKRYIHQAHRPAIGGALGFKFQQQAQAVAELVASKIEKGIMPPAVTRSEVDSLEQLYQN